MVKVDIYQELILCFHMFIFSFDSHNNPVREKHLSFPSPFYRRKLRYREVKLLTQGHIAGKCRARI